MQTDPDQLRNVARDAAYEEALKTMRALCDREMNARGGPLLPMDQRGARKSPEAKQAAKKARAR